MALLMDSPRTASVRTLSSVQVISIARSPFEKVLAATSLRKEDVTGWIRLSQQLQHSPLFAEMSANEVAHFLKRSERRPVPVGEILIREGDVGSHFYIVLSGKLKVHKKGQQIGTLTPGDFVGEIALLAPVPRTATVTAVEHTQVLELSRIAFFETLSANVSFSSKIIEVAQERRKKTEMLL
jgi:cAMP-dependent protein kinase regulator